MKTQIISIIAISSLLAGCATTHPGTVGQAIEKDSIPLQISANTVEGGTGESWQLIEVTVENPSDEWLKVSEAEVVIDDPAKSNMSVVLGSDLVDWGEAIKFRKNKESFNSAIAQTALISIGALAMLSKDKTVKTAGAVSAIGGAGWALGSEVNRDYSNATQTNKAPETHLYHPFSVPGKMFLRRWVLINKPSKMRVTNLVIRLESVEGKKGLYEVAL